MARKQDILPYRIFVGDRPLEDLTDKEREEFGDRVAQRMGDAFNRCFNSRPEEYIRYVQSQEGRNVNNA